MVKKNHYTLTLTPSVVNAVKKRLKNISKVNEDTKSRNYTLSSYINMLLDLDNKDQLTINN